MTRRLTRASARSNDNLATNRDSTSTRRVRKTRRISDSSDDEYSDLCSRNLPRTPKKNIILEDAVTPPKQKKVEAVVITPKQSNVSTNCHTPSDLLNRLSLMSPLRYKSTQNRKSLFQEPAENLSKNKTIRDEKNEQTRNEDENYNLDLDNHSDVVIVNSEENSSDCAKTKNNFYRNARKALHSSLPSCLPGREEQLKELRNFIKSHLDESTSGSMYVSGPPGTGKTASLSIILEEKEVRDFKLLHILLVHCNLLIMIVFLRFFFVVGFKLY